MCKFKKGDKVVIVKSQDGNPKLLQNGVTGVVLDLQVAPFVQFNIDANDCLHDACGIGEEGKCYSMDEDELELISDYKLSNRFKLLQAIKETGYSSRRLSDIAVGNESYFYNYTGKARFDKKGDISNDTLDNLKITLEYAVKELGNKLTDALIHEREDLDLAPKTVDENNVPMVEKSIDESVVEAKSALDSFLIDNETWFLEDSKIKDNKSKKFLIIFVLVVIILAIYFFTR